MDEISQRSYQTAVSALLARCFAQWNPIPPEKWSEDVRRMKGGLRFKWAYAPYLLKMFNSMFEPGVVETAYELFSRAGKSEVILNAIGYFIDQEPRRILSLWPTEKHAEKFSKDNLVLELFDPTEPLQFLGTKGSKRTSGNTLLHKIFPAGLLDLFGANAPGDMRRAKGNFLYADEIDAIGTEQTDEGDQIAIFAKRGSEFPDTIQVYASYPGMRGKSRIHAKIEASDWQQWFVTCLKCGGEPFVMHRNQIRYEKDAPQNVRLECPRCKELLTDAERYAMMMGGDPKHPRYDLWQATKPFKGIRGFQGNGMLWPHPVDLKKYPGGYMQTIAESEISADNSDNPERSRRVIVNTVDAEPYDPTPEAERPPDYQPIINGREDYATLQKITVPKEALIITCFTDVQSARLECEWRAWGMNEESWGLLHTVFDGDTTQMNVWHEWADQLGRRFDHALGCDIGLTRALVDSGYRAYYALYAMRYIASKPVVGAAGKVKLSKGIGRYGYPIVGARYGSFNFGTKTLKGTLIGTWGAKRWIYDRLALHGGERKGGSGYIHFGQNYSEEFIRQTVSEMPTTVYEKGIEVEKFENPGGNRNEALDLLVGNLAAFRYRVWDYARIAEDLLARAAVAKKETPPLEKKKSRMRHIGGALY